MKTNAQIFSTFLIIILVIGCSPQRENISNLEEQLTMFKENMTPISFQGEPFTGVAYQEYDNGQIETTARLKNGIINGLLEYNFENGQLKSKGTYKDGELDGLWEEYYENGQLKSKGTYKDGELDGLWEEYYENGQIFDRVTFKKGLIDGSYTQYSRKGLLEVTGSFTSGVQHGKWDFYDKVFRYLEFSGSFTNGKVRLTPNEYLKYLWDYASQNKISESSDATIPNFPYTDYYGNIQFTTLDNGWTRLKFSKDEMGEELGLLNVQNGFYNNSIQDDEWGDLTNLRIYNSCNLGNCQNYYDFSISGLWKSRDSGWRGDFILSISKNNTIEIRLLGSGKQYNMVSFSVDSVENLLGIEETFTNKYSINSENWDERRSVLKEDFVVFGVINPRTGRTWMDRNMGARQVSRSITDDISYGGYFSHKEAVLLCPPGYRLPTESEWNEERITWSSNNSRGAFDSPLKLPTAGFLKDSDGWPRGVGSYGHYWSGSVSDSFESHLFFASSPAFLSGNFRAYGLSVRCIKD